MLFIDKALEIPTTLSFSSGFPHALEMLALLRTIHLNEHILAGSLLLRRFTDLIQTFCYVNSCFVFVIVFNRCIIDTTDH